MKEPTNNLLSNISFGKLNVISSLAAMREFEVAVKHEDMVCHFLHCVNLADISQQTVKSFLFLAVYALNNPTRMSTAYPISRAVRIALSLNLHRKVSNVGVTEEMKEERRKLFWSVYMVERRYTISIRGALGFADEIIDAEVRGFASHSQDSG